VSVEPGSTWTTERTPEWPPRPAESDPGFGHFMRFLGVYFLISILSFVLVGVIVQAVILSKTGYRKRDLLLLMVPIWGAVVAVRTTWRITARTAYWSPRDDRPSEPFDNGGRGAAIVGWVLGPVAFIGIVALAAVVGTAGWTSFDKAEFCGTLESGGMSSARAQCMTDFFVTRYPEGPEDVPDEDDPALQAVTQEALAACPG